MHIMIADIIDEYIKNEFGLETEVHDDTRISELIEDSLDLFQMVMHIEKSTGKEIDLSRISQNTTIKDLVGLFSYDETEHQI